MKTKPVFVSVEVIEHEPKIVRVYAQVEERKEPPKKVYLTVVEQKREERALDSADLHAALKRPQRPQVRAAIRRLLQRRHQKN